MADPTKWTNGTLKAIADYVHSKGLKFGTYTDRGTKTCAGRPAAQGHEIDDAQTYADWGVDYLVSLSSYSIEEHDSLASNVLVCPPPPERRQLQCTR
jgi:alpha-galactosidase